MYDNSYCQEQEADEKTSYLHPELVRPHLAGSAMYARDVLELKLSINLHHTLKPWVWGRGPSGSLYSPPISGYGSNFYILF